MLDRVVMVVLRGGDSNNIGLLLLALRMGRKRIRCPSTDGREENEMIKGQQCSESTTRTYKMALKKREKMYFMFF
jgi:hypothetical protein